MPRRTRLTSRAPARSASPRSACKRRRPRHPRCAVLRPLPARRTCEEAPSPRHEEWHRRP
jgi:hypothetical protein